MRNRKEQSIDDHAKPDQESDKRRRHERKDIDLVHGHEKGNDSCAKSNRRRDHAGSNSSQSLLFRRFEKLLKLGQDVFSHLAEVLRRAHLPDLIRDCHADVLAGRNGRLRDRVRVLERVADDTQIGAANATELDQLFLLRTAGRAIHDAELYGKIRGKLHLRHCSQASKEPVSTTLRTSAYLCGPLRLCGEQVLTNEFTAEPQRTAEVRRDKTSMIRFPDISQRYCP